MNYISTRNKYNISDNNFSKITMECPREGMNDMYIGSMPNGHPDEAAHLQFAERMFSEIKRRNIL